MTTDSDNSSIVTEHAVVTPSQPVKETINYDLLNSKSVEGTQLESIYNTLNSAMKESEMTPTQGAKIKQKMEAHVESLVADASRERDYKQRESDIRAEFENKDRLRQEYPDMPKYLSYLKKEAEELGVEVDDKYLNSELNLKRARAQINKANTDIKNSTAGLLTSRKQSSEVNTHSTGPKNLFAKIEQHSGLMSSGGYPSPGLDQSGFIKGGLASLAKVLAQNETPYHLDQSKYYN